MLSNYWHFWISCMPTVTFIYIFKIISGQFFKKLSAHRLLALFSKICPPTATFIYIFIIQRGQYFKKFSAHRLFPFFSKSCPPTATFIYIFKIIMVQFFKKLSAHNNFYIWMILDEIEDYSLYWKSVNKKNVCHTFLGHFQCK